jgi:hypothetical protein
MMRAPEGAAQEKGILFARMDPENACVMNARSETLFCLEAIGTLSGAILTTMDLDPELKALDVCFRRLHKKLKI